MFLEVDLQQRFFFADKIARHCGGLIIAGHIRGYLHPEKMFSGGELHGVEFVALDLMEQDQMFLVGSFQGTRISQAIIHPDRQVGFGELVLDLDFQHRWRNCRSYCW